MISAHIWACESTGCLKGTRSICDWPVEVEVTVPAINTNIGDPWITKQGKKRGQVFEIEYFHEDGTRAEKEEAVTLLIFVQLPRRTAAYPYQRARLAGVPTLRMVPCGRYACENHVREVSADRHYCCRHWRCWESV